MNEHLLNLIGFTPEQWEDWRSRIASKALDIWQKILEPLSPARLKIGGGVILGLLALFFGVRLLASVWPRSPSSVPTTLEATPPAGIEKVKLEVDLETLRSQLEKLAEDDPDFLYPSLEIKIDF